MAPPTAGEVSPCEPHLQHELEVMLPPTSLPTGNHNNHRNGSPPSPHSPQPPLSATTLGSSNLDPNFDAYQDPSSPGDQSVGQTSVFSDQSVHSRAKLVKDNKDVSSPLDEKPVIEFSEEDLREESNQCGWGCWQPNCLQGLARVKVFVFFTCVLVVVASALTTGYLNSVITTIEKRFEIGSSSSSIVPAAYEFGNLVAVIFVSYLGASRHTPKWIGFGVLIMGTGSILFALPHLIAPKYTVRSGMAGQQENLLNSSLSTAASLLTNTSDPSSAYDLLEEAYICRTGSGAGGKKGEHCIDEKSTGNWGYVLILVAAQVLVGTGGTPIMTLGITFVDNHVTKEKSPTYLAFIHASSALGPVLGYALGAAMLQVYVDTFSHQVALTPSHPRWVGAWWAGFVLCGTLLLALAPIFLAYPRVLVKDRKLVLDAKQTGGAAQGAEPSGDMGADLSGPNMASYGRSYKEIPKATWRLLRNPVYAILLPAICCEICIVSGFVVFLPKYIEAQFGTTTSMANLFTGGIGIPGAVIGILMGGYILKRLSLTPKGAVQFVLLLNTAALCGFSLFFFLGCNNPKIAGANFPYYNSSGHKIFEANLTAACNQNCACSDNHIQPICGVNGITYFSPCHAGCTGSNRFYDAGREEKSLNYSGCSCISAAVASVSSHHVSAFTSDNSGSNSVGIGNPDGQAHHEVIISPLATLGACKNRCDRLLPFLMLLVVMTFCVAGTQMPLLMVTLRSVRTMERSFALGLQFVIMRLFAYIPSPLFFGAAIDTACLKWNVKCNRNGSCLLYDIEHFRYIYIGVAASLKVVSLCFFIALWYFIRRRTIQENKAAKQAECPEATPLTPVQDNNQIASILPSSDKAKTPSDFGGNHPGMDGVTPSELPAPRETSVV